MKKTSRAIAALNLLVALALGACSATREAPPKAPEATAAGADYAAPASEAHESKKEEPAPPPPPPKEEPRALRIDEETDPARALADAEAMLDASLSRKKKGTGVGNDGSTPPAKETAGDSCSVACRALASMRRSADRLCQLAPSASPDAPRCNDAKDRVTKAEQRVREQCPSCTASP